MPTYLKDVLSFDIKNAGFIAVLPYLALAGVVIVGGLAADWLIGISLNHFFFFFLLLLTVDLFSTANWLSRTTVRKLFETLGFLIAGMGDLSPNIDHVLKPRVWLTNSRRKGELKLLSYATNLHILFLIFFQVQD